MSDELIKRVDAIESSRSDFDNYGLTKLCDLPSITDSTGLALPSSEKNAALEGTLANMIGKANARIDGTDAKFAGLKSMIRLPENYVMNFNDFLGPGFYHLGSLAQSPAGNAPDLNVGDYKVVAFNDNSQFQVLVMLSPRDTAHMYIGRFWAGTFTGWGVINFDKLNG